MMEFDPTPVTLARYVRDQDVSRCAFRPPRHGCLDLLCGTIA
jgi:hypothetical protein